MNITDVNNRFDLRFHWNVFDVKLSIGALLTIKEIWKTYKKRKSGKINKQNDGRTQKKGKSVLNHINNSSI